MPKGITKEIIVNATLQLIKDRENIRNVNLREIARVLECAHTNLYNYYPDFDGILWDTLDEILVRSEDFILTGIDTVDDPAGKLHYFYERIIEFYLQNRGWFRLFWMEKLQGSRPDKNASLAEDTVEKYVTVLAQILEKLYNTKFINKQVKEIFHTVHCYLHGEISIFISGRGLITDEESFKKYVLGECVRISRLLSLELK